MYNVDYSLKHLLLMKKFQDGIQNAIIHHIFIHYQKAELRNMKEIS